MNTFLSILYKHYRLTLKKEELKSFLEYFHQSNVFSTLEEDCKKRLVLTFWKDEADNAISICLEEENDDYVIHQSFETTDSFLEEVIRNSISRFNVTTVAEHRLLDSAILYHYQDGVIHKIIEKTSLTEKIIYDFPLQLFIEKKTENIKKEINMLLDKRNDQANYHDIPNIDQQLKTLSTKMKKQGHT